MKISNILFIGLLMISIVGLTACTEKTPLTTISTNTSLSASQGLLKFDDIGAFRDFMSKNSVASNSVNYRGGVMMDSLAGGAAVKTAVAPTAQGVPESNGGATDYSQTNVQVEGVDEADFVKNDDRYIYIIADNQLVIIDGKKGDTSKILSKTDISVKNKGYYEGSVRDMFLDGNKVVVFVDSYEPEIYFNRYSIEPIESQRQNVKVITYDVSDKEDPKIDNEYTISGSYYSSRLIGDIVYVVSQEYLYDWQYYDGPMISYAKTTIRPDIYYFDNPEQNYNMNTITSISLKNDEVIDSMSLMLGYSNTVMVSEDNIYIAYQKQNRWCWGWRCTTYNEDARTRFIDVVVPLLKGDIKNEVKSILDRDLQEDEEWTQISTALNKFYADLKDDEKLQEQYSDMLNNIEDALNEYDSRKALEDSKTVIQKIGINGGKISYVNKGEVDGTLLNQFSMDEFDGNLRVATTVNLWLSKGRINYNNVYVLDGNMDVIGKAENLAENESIYSTRFTGNKLYMVTFRQMDPFFVIDLSNPKKPEVLGYLKIPGYSSYLHPINDNFIIGVGKETSDNEFGGVSTEGIKISLFDVSDFEKPKEVDKYVIGMAGSDSPVLYDHRAFLYSSSKNMMVIPVTEVTDQIKSGYTYRTKVWYGAYVFKVSESGLTEIGKIRHASTETQYYYWYDSTNVKRSLYIGDTLYTISDKYVKASDINNDFEELNSINLPYTGTDYGIMYSDGGSTGSAVPETVSVSAPEISVK